MSPNNFHIVQIGCGVVGYAYVQAFEAKGFYVTCIEANKNFIKNNADKHCCYHVDDDMSKITDVDFILLSINTPLKGNKLDLTYLFSSIPNVATMVKNSPEAYVVIRSTVPSGTTRRYKVDLEQIVGFPVKVLFQPEFLRDKTNFQDAMNPWHVVIGCDKGTDTTKMVEMYKHFIDEESITVMTVDEAENMKLFHNCFNAAKISFFNQCALLVNAINEKNGSNIDMNVISQCMTKTCEGLMNARYGTKAGHAYANECLPKDSAELASLEEDYGLEATMFRQVVNVNKIYQKTDKEVVLHGDHHMDFSVLKKISSLGNMSNMA